MTIRVRVYRRRRASRVLWCFDCADSRCPAADHDRFQPGQTNQPDALAAAVAHQRWHARSRRVC